MTEIEAIHMLQAQTGDFLRKCSIDAQTLGAGPASLGTFYMKDKLESRSHPGKYLGNLHRQGGQRFQAQNNAVHGGTAFPAIHIPVRPSNVAINAFPLPPVGAHVMLTTQLTGCSIVMIPGPATFSVAHLQPTGETGAALRQRLKAAGLQVYGMGDFGVGRATVVGVRLGGSWRFFAQAQDAYFNVMQVKELTA